MQLPRLYELVQRDALDDVLLEACRHADAGADEGRVIHAAAQSAASGRCGQPWLSVPGGLYAAVILRPEQALEQAAQLSLVAAVSLAAAIADHVEPLTELHLGWPNDLLLRQAKVGTVQLRWRADGDALRWMVLGTYVNVAQAPASLGLDAACLREEGESVSNAADLLGSFARHFLVWIDRWANEGFAPVRKAWLQRAAGIGAPCVLRAGDRSVTGQVRNVADDGALLLEQTDGVESISLRSAFSPIPGGGDNG